MREQTKLIVVCMGLIASGKSFLARAWAGKHRFPYFNTDVIRKQLAGIAQTESRPEEEGQGIYSAEFTRRTYDTMLVSAWEALQDPAVCCVVLDGSYQTQAERERVRDTFGECARIVFVLCSCDEAVTKARLVQRAAGPATVSDGRWDIYLCQKEKFQYPEELPVEQFRRMDTNAPLDSLLEHLDGLLKVPVSQIDQ
jgi:uncharacterized protein